MQTIPFNQAIVANPQVFVKFTELAEQLSLARRIALLGVMAVWLKLISAGDPNITFESLPAPLVGPLVIALLHVTMGTPLFLSDQLFDQWEKSGGDVNECVQCGYRMPAPSPTCAVCGGATGEGGIWTKTRAAKAGMN